MCGHKLRHSLDRRQNCQDGCLPRNASRLAEHFGPVEAVRPRSGAAAVNYVSKLCLAMLVQDCRIIELPKITERRGNLTFIEGGRHVPFEIRRVYYLYDVPGGSEEIGR